MTELTFDCYIGADAERVWDVLTDPGLIPLYRFGHTFDCDWEADSPLVSRFPDGRPGIEGKVLESRKRERLVHTWQETGMPSANGGRASLVTYALTTMGDVTHLRITHDDLDPDGMTIGIVGRAWPLIISGLKTLIETGKPLPIPAPGS
ncbi:SRPBCC domain-containing protein [Nonomuraea sp. CA-141351]|uniref:SRPBCC domain-containing protein n=1 Tax=Nonomuraea sp. CA-141351 TaxID=3239996 RepID=UPI003D93314A